MPKTRRKIAAADCETDPFEHGAEIKPFIWGIVYEDGTREVFHDTEEFINSIRDQDMIVYAHNGGKFDWHFIAKYINDFSPVMIINGRLAKFKIGNCEFRDSYSLFPLPLAAYKKDEFDYSKLRKEVRHKHMDEITKYMIADCEYLLEIVLNFIESFGMNLTLASAAMKQWKKISGDPPKSSAFYYDTYSRFYYGGRVEPFERGVIRDENIYMYDINSAYPYAMLFSHPYGGNIHSAEYDGKIRDRGFYIVTAPSRGFFPYRCPDTDRLLFPADNEIRKFAITGWELRLYAQYYQDFEIKGVFLSSTFTDFKEYIYKWYELKNNSPKASTDYLFAKLMMNSLYGKFGANAAKYKEYEIIPDNFIAAHSLETGKTFSGQIGEKALMANPLPEDKQRYFDVCTAASITGFVRAYLFEAILKVREAGGRVLYCDTDSIAFIHDKPKSIFNMGDELGQWDSDGHFNFAAIAGKKLYAFKDKDGKYKTASKGVKLTPKQIISVANGNTEVWESIAPTFSLKKEPYYQKRKVRQT